MGAPTALVVDGDWRIRKLIRTNLEAGGLRVVEAGDAQGCLSALDNAPVDLLLLSAQLPDANGWNLARRLRVGTGHTELPIIVMVQEPANSRLLRRFHRVSQLLKPFSALTLLASVDQALSSYSP